ncbi:2-hydroxychromene-2-carboxylate isomerase [Actinokineospora inagensis]|uniref:2-hydroxychromene-2-carboxylate isomerase n=1 Tax=Actinokineospora inagensis TaxID=103730 RepID=UPI000415EBE9|nr:DsbA family protein [Actinokineospora inagensis]
MSKPKKAVYYFSLRSPYAWLAQYDLATKYADVAEVLRWRPFWEPTERGDADLRAAGGRFVYTPMSKEKHLYILQDVRRLAAARGLSVKWPVDRDPDWEISHLPWFAAADAGIGQRYVEAVQRARWQEGRDICDPTVIKEICAELGIEAFDGTLSDSLRERSTAALMDLHHDDVFGVPFFVYGRDKYWGLDRLPQFVDAVRAGLPAPEAAVPEVALNTRDSDFGHAGGCG